VSSTKLTIVYSTNSNLIVFNGHRNDHSNGPLQSNISHKELGICTHECNDGLLRGLEYDPGGLVLNVKFSNLRGMFYRKYLQDKIFWQHIFIYFIHFCLEIP